MRADNWWFLCGVDQSRGKLSCLIDPECAIEVFALLFA